jgi:hypothetical protein
MNDLFLTMRRQNSSLFTDDSILSGSPTSMVLPHRIASKKTPLPVSNFGKDVEEVYSEPLFDILMPPGTRSPRTVKA